MLPSMQRKRSAAVQMQWAGNARADMNYNIRQARRDRNMGNVTLARMHEREARWDRFWMNRRVKLAKKYLR